MHVRAISDPATPVDDAPTAARWFIGVGVVIVALVLLRLAAPYVLAPLIESRLSRALAVQVDVDDVDLGIVSGELAIHGITAAPDASVSRSGLTVETVALQVHWRDMFRGRAFVHAKASGVAFTLDVERPWPQRGDVDDTSGGVLRSAVIEGGRLALVLGPDTPPVDVLTDVRATIDDDSPGPRTTAMSSHVSLEASVGSGSLAVVGHFSPVASAANWSLELQLERLDLQPFNPIFESYFEMDVEQGWLSLHGDLNVGMGRLRGRITPRFDELQLLGRGEERVRHPMAEALFGAMLASADIPIVFDQPAPFEGGFGIGDLDRLEPMELLETMIARGFTRRLDTIAGYESRVGHLELDFATGRLSFFDVVLEKTDGELDTPFVSVPRLDIVVEQSAVDSEIPTYKAITLHQPALVFVTGDSEATSQLRFDPLWQEKVSVLPYPTDRVEVKGGRIEYRNDTTDPPTSLYAAEIDLVVDNLGRARTGDARRAAPLRASARVMDISSLRVEADLSPGAVPIDASVRLEMDALPLRELNDVLRARMQVDVTGGTLAVEAELDVFEGRAQGSVSPSLPGITVIGSRETEFQKPLRELMLERRLRKLDGRSLAVDFVVPEDGLLRELPSALLAAALHAP